tara:strand:- start:2797 stop:3504 length:708 start_codon:yes stop_codon:yes gene_type:complete
MNTVTTGVAISPVNMEDRKNIGIKAGDTVRVHQKIQDKGKTRIQVFEGVVLARKHGSEPGATFTVRKMASGVGVEKIFPLYSPSIDKIEIVKRAKVRRAKLYFIREKVAREIKRQMRRMRLVSIASESEAEAAVRAEAEEEAAKAAEEAKKAEEAAAEATKAESTTQSDESDSEADKDATEDAPAAEVSEEQSESDNSEDTQSETPAEEATEEVAEKAPAEEEAAEVSTDEEKKD